MRLFLLFLAVSAYGVSTIWPWIDDARLVPELLGQARLHIMVVGAFLVLICLCKKRTMLMLCCLLLTLANLFWLMQSVPIVLRDDTPSDGWQAKVLSFNVWVKNYRYRELAELINDSNADIIWLQEIRKRDVTALREMLNPEYTHVVYPEQTRLQDVSVLISRHPVTGTDVIKIDTGVYYHFMRRATLDVAGKPVEFLGLHVRSPKSDARVKARNWQYEQTAEYITNQYQVDDRLIVAGDFNSAPWRPSFQAMLRSSGVTPTVSLPYLPLSWPTWLPWPLAVPIDHIMIRGDLCAGPQQRIPLSDSDHYPVSTTIWECMP